MEINEENLIEIADKIDSFFNDMVMENELSLGAFNGIFMARMTRMNEAYKNMEQFKDLLQTIVDGRLQDDEVSIQ
jgi:hypothetical protein